MNYQNTLLEKIVQTKKEEIASGKLRESLQDLRNRCRDAELTRSFVKMFDPSFLSHELPQTRIIAEIKKASPSAGLIRPDFDPVRLAHTYVDAGAAAISVLTDTVYFQGSLSDLQSVRKVSPRPVLRKDFMIDPYQIYEARAYGADCILAIVAILEKQQLIDLCGLANELGMASLIEVHNEEETRVALQVDQPQVLLGVNNRDLKTLKIDLKTTERLRKLIPSKKTVIAESGISNRKEIEHYLSQGVSGFLIGEVLMKEKNIRAKFDELLGR